MALIDVESPSSTIAVDPSTYPQPTPNAPIGPSDPSNTANRYTINVPTGNTQLSLGAPPGEGWGGITGRTNAHAHFYVDGALSGLSFPMPPGFQFDPKSVPTLVSFGFNNMAAPALPFNGALVPVGYFMDTAGEAYHRSVGNHTLESSAARAMVTAPDSVNLETDGFISLSAGENMKRGAYYDDFLDQIKREYLVTMGIFAGMFALGMKLYSVKHKPLEGKPGYRTLQLQDAGKLGAKLAFLADHTTTLIMGWGKDKEPGKISLFAKKSVSIVGNASVALSGRTSTSTAAISASMGAPLTTVKGYILLQMWSLWTTTVSGLKNVRLKSDLGSAKVVGKKHAELTSRDGLAYVFGHKGVQVNSNEGQVHIHGKERVYVGAGAGALTQTKFKGGLDKGGTYAPGPGMALSVAPHVIAIGKVDDATDFKKPKVQYNVNPHVAVSDADGSPSIRARLGDRKFTITQDAIEAKYAANCYIRLNTNEVRIQGPTRVEIM
jgi:hypothetical protein